MSSKWLPIKQVETLTQDAPVGFIGLRLLCYTKKNGTQSKAFPSKNSKPWPFPEDKATELIRSLAQAGPSSPISQRPRIQVTVKNGKGAFTGFWPGPSMIDG